MQIKVVLLDGSVVKPVFDPEHRQGVLRYYAERLVEGSIKSYEIVQ